MPQLQTDEEYCAIAERWIVTAYKGARPPRVELATARGTIELELYPGDAPLGFEYLIRVIESGEIVGYGHLAGHTRGFLLVPIGG